MKKANKEKRSYIIFFAFLKKILHTRVVTVIIIFGVDDFGISMSKFDGLLLFSESKNDVDVSRSEERVIVGNVPAVKTVNDFVEK